MDSTSHSKVCNDSYVSGLCFAMTFNKCLTKRNNDYQSPRSMD